MNLSVKKYMLIDSSKMFVKGFCSFISINDFDAIICNNDDCINKEDLSNNFILVE